MGIQLSLFPYGMNMIGEMENRMLRSISGPKRQEEEKKENYIIWSFTISSCLLNTIISGGNEMLKSYCTQGEDEKFQTTCSWVLTFKNIMNGCYSIIF